jgi:beta-glucosidase/6-phospho-beta-glucosidase/beta-galactosidase
LSAGFLFGSAVSAHQVESGRHASDWHQWEQHDPWGGSRIDNGDRADDGPNFARVNPDGTPGGQFRAYLTKARAMGHNAFRFSIDWSRVQPRPGPYDPAGIGLYRAILAVCRELGLKPVVTLQHFTLPTWIHDVEDPESGLGGWAGPAGAELGRAPIVDAFARFAGDMAAELGGEVDLWITINEPMVAATGAYVSGDFPPGHEIDLQGLRRAAVNMGLAHAKAYDAIKARDDADADGDGVAAQVGLAQHIRRFIPHTGSAADAEAVTQLDYLGNALHLDAAATGDADWNADGRLDGPAEGRGRVDLKNRLDFVGINYYSRSRVIAYSVSDGDVTVKGFPIENTGICTESSPWKPENATDLCWEIHPDGMRESIAWAWARYHRPIYVTESGMAEVALPDAKRPRFVVEHLDALERAAREGADVRGYLHWSLMDNFEWHKGFWPRFGLLRVDYRRPERPFTETRGAQAYTEIIRAGGVTPAIRERWAPGR